MSYAGLALLALTTGCATNVVTLSPLDTKHPVSASAEYVDHDGAVVRAEDYEVVAPFDFAKEARTRWAHGSSELQIAPKLDGLVQAAHGDAVTNLRIQATSLSQHQNLFSIMGLGVSAVGLILLAPAISAMNDPEKSTNPMLVASTAVLAAGSALVITGELTRPTSWHFRISGQVVRARPTPPLRPRPLLRPLRANLRAPPRASRDIAAP